MPEAGYFGIFDHSWYPEASSHRVTRDVSKQEAEDRIESINKFERQLVEDGTLIIKIFLHISQKEQKKRLDNLYSHKSTAWRVSDNDYKNNKKYDQFFKVYNNMLTKTNTDYAPWHIVDSQDKNSAIADVYKIIVSHLTAKLAAKKLCTGSVSSNDAALSSGDFSLVMMPSLSEVHLSQKLADDDYDIMLKKHQKHLKKLHNKLYLNKIPLVVAYEGWDAAGKGGNIRRLTAALDPRGYEVVPIAAPTPTEKNHQYLWRFWQHIPKDGHITIFDRTWYGRVMVERVEGFASEEEWQRAYREINEFEQELTNWGAIVVKFWLQISKDEQLARFKTRQETPDKQWKITDEDWRNREKWDQYDTAVNDMLRLTSTVTAPWTIVESESKQFARIKAMETVIDAIEQRL